MLLHRWYLFLLDIYFSSIFISPRHLLLSVLEAGSPVIRMIGGTIEFWQGSFLSGLYTADLFCASSRSRGEEAHRVIYKDTHSAQEGFLSRFNHVPKLPAPGTITLG